VRDDGVLRWVYRPPVQELHQGRRAWRSLGVDARDVVQRSSTRRWPQSDTSALVALDLQLNPNRGLGRWVGCLAAGRRKIGHDPGPCCCWCMALSAAADVRHELQATPQGRQLFDRISAAAPTLRGAAGVRPRHAVDGALAERTRPEPGAGTAALAHRCRLPQPRRLVLGWR
jgi:hypothetical protein